jgi:hypothetical protein
VAEEQTREAARRLEETASEPGQEATRSGGDESNPVRLAGRRLRAAISADVLPLPIVRLSVGKDLPHERI